MVVIDLAVMQSAQQTLFDQRLGGLKLIGITALKADASPHAMLLSSRHNIPHLSRRIGHRFFQDDVLLCLGSSQSLIAVLAGVTRNINGMQTGVGEHLIQVLVGLNPVASATRSMLGAQLGGVEWSRRIDSRDLPLPSGVDRRNVRRCRPPVSNDADVDCFHDDFF